MGPYSTPTFTFTFPVSVDFSQASSVWFTLKQSDRVIINKTGEDVETDGNVVSVFLSQQDTQRLIDNTDAEVKINWAYPPDGLGRAKRGKMKPIKIHIDSEILRRIIE